MQPLMIAFLFAAGALIAFALSLLYKPGEESAARASEAPAAGLRDTFVVRLETEINALRGQLEETTLEYKKLEEEAGILKRQEAQLKEGSEKLRQLEIQEREELDKVKKDYLQLKQDLSNRQDDKEKEQAKQKLQQLADLENELKAKDE